MPKFPSVGASLAISVCILAFLLIAGTATTRGNR